MRSTSSALVAVLAVGVAVAPAHAATKKPKPITKSYTASAPLPDPSNQAGLSTHTCARNVPQSFDLKTFTAPALGKLKVELSGFTGDWDLLLLDSEDGELTNSGSSDLGSPTTAATEAMSYKFKKAKKKVKIVACNFAGGSSAKVKYTFTYS
jgi:hypothetical protein